MSSANFFITMLTVSYKLSIISLICCILYKKFQRYSRKNAFSDFDFTIFKNSSVKTPQFSVFFLETEDRFFPFWPAKFIIILLDLVLKNSMMNL